MAGSSTADSAVLRFPARATAIRTAVTDVPVEVRPVGPTGVARHDPFVTATRDGVTACFTNCSPERATNVAAKLADGTVPTESAADVVEHEGEGRPDFELPGFSVGTRRVLAGAGWERPASPQDYRKAGGFDTVTSDDILGSAATLRGRGWGDWHQDEPIVEHWRTLHSKDRSPAIVVNAHGDLDAFLCESVPLKILEGACLAAQVTNASRIIVYLSTEATAAVEHTEAAGAAYPEPPAPITVETGPAVYRAGEPTMALEALEGNHRLEARLRTPGRLPMLAGQPALVHTARTLAHLATSVRAGEASTTRVVSIGGDVPAPATVELSTETPLSAALDAVENGEEFKAACVGGRFGGLTDTLDVRPTPDALSAADLGTEGSIELLGPDRCVLSFIGRRANFAAEANCGRCVPCREGSKQLVGLLRDVYDGDFEQEGISELVRTMHGASLCAFGVEAARPARTALEGFEWEVAAHADGRCPTGTCEVT
ncbi:MAG: NADH-ubiquinone oxidoreductase-F iron-sulfur binding region domain-containing protein [Salinirussus sp.]